MKQLTEKENQYLDKLVEFFFDMAVEELKTEAQQGKHISNSSKTPKTLKK